MNVFQDGERCGFLAQEGREGDAEGVPQGKVQAAEGKQSPHHPKTTITITEAAPLV